RPASPKWNLCHSCRQRARSEMRDADCPDARRALEYFRDRISWREPVAVKPVRGPAREDSGRIVRSSWLIDDLSQNRHPERSEGSLWASCIHDRTAKGYARNISSAVEI